MLSRMTIDQGSPQFLCERKLLEEDVGHLASPPVHWLTMYIEQWIQLAIMQISRRMDWIVKLCEISLGRFLRWGQPCSCSVGDILPANQCHLPPSSLPPTSLPSLLWQISVIMSPPLSAPSFIVSTYMPYKQRGWQTVDGGLQKRASLFCENESIFSNCIHLKRHKNILIGIEGGEGGGLEFQPV